MSSQFGWTAGENHDDVYFYTGGLQEMMKEYLLNLSDDDGEYDGFEEDSEDELTEEEKRYYDELADYYDSYYDDYNDY
ncbi:hypothetical protein EB169_11450 [archaeon]|nr:hypothetical protein [archaeon]NDB56424.1 hypothetical protein [archaeon]